MISRLAWRNLWRNKERSLLMISAVAIAVCAMLFMVAMTRGFMQGILDSGINNLPGHLQAHAAQYLDDPSIDHRFNTPSETTQSVLDDPSVARWFQRIKVTAVVQSEYASQGVTLLGIEPEREIQDRRLGYRVVEGEDITSQSNGILIGAKLSEKLETELGKRIVLMTQSGNGALAERGYRIVGVYQTTFAAKEEAEVYLPLNQAQSLLEVPNQISEIALFTSDIGELERLQDSLQTALGAEIEVLRWDQIDEYLSASMQTMSGFVFIIVAVVFLTLSFALVNTLIMAIFERTPEIGLLLALGLKPRSVVAALTLESMVMIGIGLVVGNVLAQGILFGFRDGIDLSSVAEGLAMAGASPYLTAQVNVSDWLTTNLLVLLLGLLTSWWPARRAARLDPVEALQKT
jgi:ABC-type lipoprotein release transport system permease subunit